MSNVDYSRYAKAIKTDPVEIPCESVVESVPEELVGPRTIIESEVVDNLPALEAESVIDPVIESESEETPAPIIEPAVPKIGRVYNCEKLNVRQEPKATAPVVCELFRNAEVEIHEFGSTDDFYMVYTASGITGFCMKTYILEK